MIEDIKKIGISDEFYNLLIENLGYDIVLNLACNYELVKKNINLLKSYGIENIEELLLNRDSLFLKDSEEIFEKLNKQDIETFVMLVNSDYTNIDSLFL